MVVLVHLAFAYAEADPKNKEEESLMQDPQAMTPPEILGIEEKNEKAG